MPRNGSGTMTVPNSFTSGATIESATMNANFSDVASEITGSLPRDGQAAMTGAMKAANGTAALPSVTFGSDTDTGFYRASANTVGVSSGGTSVGTIGANGFVDKNSVIITGIPTGAIMMYGATTAPTGWLRMNAKTIGNASSGATERANADTEDLFAFLWNNYGDTVCAVSGGRGANAAVDYAANKTIALPDGRGRGPFGLDDMGNSAAGRLGTIITSSTTNGASGGTETVTLTESQMPTHTHTASVTDPGHTHTYSTPVYTVSSANNTTSVSTSATSAATGSATTGISVSNSSTGGSAAHSNMPPAFLTTFIIKL